MYCPKCGQKCEDGASFCPSCGNNLTQQSAQGQQQNQQQNPNYQQNQQYQQNPNYQQNQQYQQGYQQPPYQQPGYTGPIGRYRVPIKNRSIAVCIILSIVTCGIYGIYWFICMANDLNLASGRQNDTSGGIVYLLGIVTCGIYLFYWLYQAGEKVSEIRRRNGEMVDSNNGLVYLLLAIFTAGIVSYALIQNELNKVATIVG